MGCDYYIIKGLEVVHAHGTSRIELTRDKGYFLEFDFDSDESGYSQKRDDFYLNVTYKPIVLYQDGHWRDDKVKLKYQDLVSSYANELVSVIKKEWRQLR